MPRKKLLIIEDEPAVAKQLKWSLGEEYDISLANDTEKAKKLISCGAFPVATLDLGLPPSPDTPRVGLQLLKEMAALAPLTKIIAITGHTEQDTAIKAVTTGAVDFCSKPIDLNILRVILDRTFKLSAIQEAGRELLTPSDQCDTLCGMIGVSPVMQKLFAMVRKISSNEYPVLVLGESGTGKEMIANAIHQLSPRRRHPLVVVNCGAIPQNLLESELFGHERGAFTGAVAQKIGKLELGDKGTIFLDEVGELPLSMQVKILRCLQEGTIERIGGNKTISLDIRVVAATNIDLKAAVDEEKFRQDLYFRLNVLPIELPRLRDRPEDIMVLAQHFVCREADILKIGRVEFASAAVAALYAHDWPGNVRELQNRIRRALAIWSGQKIEPEHLGLGTIASKQGEDQLLTLKAARDHSELQCLRQALQIAGNNKTQAAKLLNISRPTLHDLIKKHRINTQNG